MEPPTIASRAPDRTQAAREAQVLAQRVAAVRQRIARLLFFEGMLRAITVLLVAVGAGMVADAFGELPRTVRVGWLCVAFVAFAAVLAVRVLRPLLRLPSEQGVALLIERRRPDLRSRLISALQLAGRPGDNPDAEAFVDRMVVDAGDATADLDVRRTVPPEDLKRCARTMLPILLGLVVAFGATWPRSGTLLRRAWGAAIELPRRTRIVEVTGARTLGRGDDFAVAAVVEGVIPPVGKLLIRHESGRQQQLSLDPDSARAGRFARTLANVPSSFFYKVRINDAESEEFAVDVLPRPVTTNLVLTQVLPEYTGLPPRSLELGDLSLLRGSRLRIVGTASQPLQTATIRLLGVGGVVTGLVDTAHGERYEAELPITDPRLTAFSVDLVDRRGIPSQDSAVYAVDVVRDGAPQVRMILPARREELVTLRGTALLAWEVKDDFGLATLRLCHQPPGSTNAVPAHVDLDLTGETNAVVRRRFEWRLDGLVPPVREGSLIEFWVEATDRNTVDGPGVGRSERYLLRVVSEAEKRADLLGRAGDAIGRLSDVALGQERLNESLGRIILAKPTAP